MVNAAEARGGMRVERQLWPAPLHLPYWVHGTPALLDAHGTPALIVARYSVSGG